MKIKRVWRAFCRGFWQAWLELPPQSAKSAGEITVTLTCDDRQFQRQTEAVIERLRDIQRMMPPAMRGN